MGMTPEWKELKRKFQEAADGYGHYALLDMAEIENRTLPQRVAEILEKSGTLETIVEGNLPLGASITRYTRLTIAQALRSGDTTEIEKWVRK
jgi:hypothetical protein